MLQNDVELLKNQLQAARNEINKLRQQVKNLQCKQLKDINGVTNILNNFRCEGCQQRAKANKQNSNDDETTANNIAGTQLPNGQMAAQNAVGGNREVSLPTIGIIRTAFPEKRAVPRQASIAGRLRGAIELNAHTFTNPEHALDGLHEYSHLWIIYHFHKNVSHAKAKVAPPRLSGERVGVFSTRSPHRPAPIGLSLVEIERIEGATITFYGTDMVDGTPVLDIKPYIPHYDAPNIETSGRLSVVPQDVTFDFYDSRQEPDGEESELELLNLNANSAGAGCAVSGAVGGAANDIAPTTSPTQTMPPATPAAVRVPNWVMPSTRHLNVLFNEHAEQQLKELQVNKNCIIDILETDPRSVYLRTKYGSQIFTFQLSEVNVTCKFDDKAATVTVVQIRPKEQINHNQNGDGNEQQQQQAATTMTNSKAQAMD